MVTTFKLLIIAHIVTGTTGLLAMWVPVLTRKGSPNHKLWGRVFVYAMVATGTIAVGISICSLIAPLATHPFSQDAPLIRGLFGWMMMYLGVLTVALAWHSFVTVRHKRDQRAQATPLNYALQAAMGISALACAGYGIAIGQVLMVAVAVPGTVAAILNSHYLAQRDPLPDEWLVQHFRCGIGAGISVYTAFLAFGAVNWVPVLAFNPVLWAIPTVLGVTYMVHHQWQNFLTRERRGLALKTNAGALFARLGRYGPNASADGSTDVAAGADASARVERRARARQR